MIDQGFGSSNSDYVQHQALVGLFVSNICWALSIFATKLSILLFYLRLFGEHQNARRWIHVLVFIVPAWAIAAVCTAVSLRLEIRSLLSCPKKLLTSIFRCIPVATAFEAGANHGCSDAHAIQAGISAPHILIDVILLILPIPIVTNMALKRSQKLALSAVFGLGAL